MRFVRAHKKPDRLAAGLLVVASPRSATRYIARALRSVGFSIGHERVMMDGSVSSFFAVDDYYYMPSGHTDRQRRSQYQWAHVWHQTRHPLKVIGSLYHGQIRKPWWVWQERHTGVGWEPHPDCAARAWLRWQQIIEADPEVTLRYRIEDLPEVWPEMMRRLGKDGAQLPSLHPEYGKTPNSRPVQLSELSPDVAEAVAKKAAEYGYAI